MSFEPNDAEALFDGAAYAEMPALLARARHSIRLTFFLFGGPDADAMIEVMAAQAARGVSVRVLLDRSLGAYGLLPDIIRECRRAFRRMRALNLNVRLSDPTPLPDWPGKTPLSHHKFIVVDDCEALVGGMNVGTLFRRYHDGMVHLIGPAARALGRQFDRDWPEKPPCPQNDRRESQSGSPELGKEGLSLVRLLGTGRDRCLTEAALRENLRCAERSVCVAVCEMGRTDLLNELIACHQRGVSVRVLLCPLRLGALLPDGILNVRSVAALRQAGVPVHLYQLGPDFMRLHLKMAIFDGTSAVTGSSNWTRSGFQWIGETDVELRGGPVIDQLAARFEADWLRSYPAPPPSLGAKWLHGLYERQTQ